MTHRVPIMTALLLALTALAQLAAATFTPLGLMPWVSALFGYGSTIVAPSCSSTSRPGPWATGRSSAASRRSLL